MNGSHAYWLIRITLSIGMATALLTGAIIQSGGISELENETEESDNILIPVVVGLTVGYIWDMIIVAGITSYIVYDSIHLIQPPLYESPRNIFRDDSL